jgi:Zn-dependent peptidase ImmA (M78 family)
MHFEDLLRNVEFVENNVPRFIIKEEEMSATEIARAVRQKWMLPRGPVDNLTQIVEEAGCIIMHCDFGTRMLDGLSLCMPKSPPMMFINKDVPGDRLRFTIAHELGHIVMHDYYTPEMEDEANEFASEFLMPAQDIRHELSQISIDRLATLKLRWKVSMQSLLMRAASLNKINDRSKQYLWMQMGQAGYRTHEPVEIDLEIPTLYREIIDLHLEDLSYTVDELCEVINMNKAEFEQIYFGKQQGLRLVK